jgi:hypothetical protein
MRVHGNFEVTASFENFRFIASEKGSCGISLTAILQDVGKTHCTVYRGALIEEEKPNRHFVLAEFIRTPGDKPQQTWHGTTSEESTSGRLRLARVGETLYCLIAEMDSPHFRLVHSEKVGTESLLLGGIRLTTAVNSQGRTPGRTSVIWKDITIRAERITDWPGEDSVDSQRAEPGVENSLRVKRDHPSALGKLLFEHVTTVYFHGPGMPANSDGSLGGWGTPKADVPVQMSIYENYIVQEALLPDGTIWRDYRAYDQIGRVEQLIPREVRANEEGKEKGGNRE